MFSTLASSVEVRSADPAGAGWIGALLLPLCIGLSSCISHTRGPLLPKTVTTTVYDEFGREVKDATTTTGSNYRILGLGPRDEDPLAVSQDSQDQDLSEEEQKRRRDAAIRNQFGPTVLIRGDLVTKRYFMSGETGTIFERLMSPPGAPTAKPGAPAPKPGEGKTLALGGKDDKSILGSMLGDAKVDVSYVPDFETVPKIMVSHPAWKGGPMAPAGVKPDPGNIESKNALLLVTATAANLLAFENTLNLFFSNIPQVEIEVKVVEFTTSDAISFGVSQIGTNPTFNNLSSSKLVSDITSSFPLVPPLGSGSTDKGLFTLGGIHDGWELSAVLEALEVRGQADVISSPKLVVRNGGTAAIATFTEFPFPTAQFNVGGVPQVNVSFRPVGITLGIKPVIAGTETVILQIHADVSAVTGFADTKPPTPIVSSRAAFTTVHVPNGKTTVIGGLRTSTRFVNENKVPILGDIPILGYLFRSTSIQHTETELQFFITPRIRIGSQDALAR